MKKEKEEEVLDPKKLKRDEEGKFILPLKDPITYGEKKISELKLTEPRTKHLRRLSASPSIDEILIIVSDLAGETDSVIDELSMRDGAQAAEFFSAFM